METRDKFETIVERSSAVTVSLFLGGLTYLALHLGWYKLNADSKITEMLTAVVSVSAISVGFLGTIAAILISLEGRKAIEVLKDLGLYVRLYTYIMWAVSSSFCCAVVSTCLILFGDLKTPSFGHFVVLSLWAFLASLSCLTVLLVVVIFSMILHRVAKDSQKAV